MLNVMAALWNIDGANQEQKFRNSLPCPTPPGEEKKKPQLQNIMAYAHYYGRP